jgi:hypothetical protein
VGEIPDDIDRGLPLVHWQPTGDDGGTRFVGQPPRDENIEQAKESGLNAEPHHG